MAGKKLSLEFVRNRKSEKLVSISLDSIDFVETYTGIWTKELIIVSNKVRFTIEFSFANIDDAAAANVIAEAVDKEIVEILDWINNGSTTKFNTQNFIIDEDGLLGKVKYSTEII